MPNPSDRKPTGIYRETLDVAKLSTGDDSLALEHINSPTWKEMLPLLQDGITTYTEANSGNILGLPSSHLEYGTMPTPIDPEDDSDIPDPTYGYFVVFQDPPPDVRNLPDARTDADAISAATAIAQDHAATLTLRHHTETGTLDLGTATPDGSFTRVA